MAIRTGNSTERGTPRPGELFLNTETRQLEVGDGSGWWGTDLHEITSQVSGARFPADVIDLRSWKVTLPVRDGGKLLEVAQPELATYAHDSFFTVNAGKDGVRFRVFHGGATTGNSKNPRTELREMRADGSRAEWSMATGSHRMEIRGRVNRLTEVKPHVVIGQIHGGSDDRHGLACRGEVRSPPVHPVQQCLHLLRRATTCSRTPARRRTSRPASSPRWRSWP